MSIIELTSETFESTVLQSDLPFLVDFWAEWCGPCKMVAPIVDEIAREQDGIMQVGKLNVDEQQEIALLYRILSIPTLMLFKSGQPVVVIPGAMPKDALMKQISPHL
ncbi:MAG: thioredoxin [Coriobacteriales bacterium]|jgi:thioredoxin 1|nr:thioredoxin [Coriobacteriales bacterium]